MAAGDVKLTGGGDRHSLSVQECFFWFFIKSLVSRGINLSNAVMLLSAVLEDRQSFQSGAPHSRESRVIKRI